MIIQFSLDLDGTDKAAQTHLYNIQNNQFTEAMVTEGFCEVGGTRRTLRKPIQTERELRILDISASESRISLGHVSFLECIKLTSYKGVYLLTIFHSLGSSQSSKDVEFFKSYMAEK